MSIPVNQIVLYGTYVGALGTVVKLTRPSKRYGFFGAAGFVGTVITPGRYPENLRIGYGIFKTPVEWANWAVRRIS